jgi:hypothetical protein
MIEIEDYDKLVYLQETTQQCAEEMSQPYTYIEEVNQGAYGRVRSRPQYTHPVPVAVLLLLYTTIPRYLRCRHWLLYFACVDAVS